MLGPAFIPTPFYAGWLSTEVEDAENSIRFPVHVYYPTLEAPQSLSIGPFTLEVKPGAAVAAGAHPVVLVSHGGGSSPLLLRPYAEYLARRGYIAAMPQHHGDHRGDSSLSNSRKNLQLRPRHICLTLDWLCSDSRLGRHVSRAGVAVLGHSMGGYTALAAAGAQPWWSPEEAVPVTADARVKILVLMAPATAWFVAPGALQNVHVPLLLYAGGRDTITPRWQAQLLLDCVPEPGKVELRMADQAGHYSFLSFPESMRRPGFAPMEDAAGFDRPAFQQRLCAEIVEFLGQGQLPPTCAPPTTANSE